MSSIPLNHYHFQIVDSTNTWALHWAHTFNPKKITLVTAEEQTKGRGQHGRSWSSPPDENVYATYTIFLPEHFNYLSHTAPFMGIVASETLKGFGLTPKLRWPNDLMLEGKKCGGILCESKPIGIQRAMAIGIGINVNTKEEVLEQLDQPATSLGLQLGKPIHPDRLIERLTEKFSAFLPSFLENGALPWLEAYRSQLINPEKMETEWK